MKLGSKAEEILKNFSDSLREIPQSNEVFYDLDQRNVLRLDRDPEKNKDTYEGLKEIAPKMDSEGYIIVERRKL